MLIHPDTCISYTQSNKLVNYPVIHLDALFSFLIECVVYWRSNQQKKSSNPIPMTNISVEIHKLYNLHLTRNATPIKICDVI